MMELKTVLMLVVINYILFWPKEIHAKFQCVDRESAINEYDLSQNFKRALRESDEWEEYKIELVNLFKQINDSNEIGLEQMTKRIQKLQFPDSLKESNQSTSTTPEIIEANGYPVEVHQVTTSDGYILEIHRIPASPKSTLNAKGKIPVLLMHGFLESSHGWIVLGPKHSLAYLLADAGYDVWLGNARGTRNSRRHIKYQPDGRERKEFWSFSWHEIGVYDLPATIDYILEETKRTQLHYVGYSQGATAFLVMTSILPSYNEKIIWMNAIAPVAFLRNIQSIFHRVFQYMYRPIKITFELFKIYELDVNNQLLSMIGEIACNQTVSEKTSVLCRGILYMIASNQLNCSTIPLILEHTPAGAATRQPLHFAQLMRTGEFKQFDYDSPKKNEEIYGSTVPPNYNLTEITVPMHFFYSENDETATIANVEYLRSHLRNVKGSYVVPNKEFAHVDFIYSVYVKKLLNDKIISVMEKVDLIRKKPRNNN